MNVEVTELLYKWLRRVKRAQLAHRLSAKYSKNRHMQVGIPAIALSTIVGTSVFASFSVDVPGGKIIVGLLSMCAAVLTALQTFLRFDDVSRNHQKADVGYAEIRQEIEQRLVFPLNDDSMQEFCDLIREKIEKLNEESPLVEEKIWKIAKQHVRNEAKANNLIPPNAERMGDEVWNLEIS